VPSAADSAAKGSGVTCVGVVLVHGVGEQRRFDHLSAEVKSLVAALSAMHGVSVSIETRSSQDSEIGAANESWRVEGSAPVKIHVAHGAPPRTVCLCVHEVWWADLDDKETLWNRFKFWLWGLGFWGVKKFSEPTLQGAQLDMTPPKFPQLSWGGDFLRETVVRLRLWAFANVFVLSALTVNLLNYVLRGLRLGQLPGVEVFYQFVGDVKLYQDRGAPHLGPLTNLGEPRRAAIRRRMVQVLVDAYRAHYERWFVLAHSLGSVVAWNGLMETAHALPNYLSRETWAALKAAEDPVLGPRKDGEKRSVTEMRPARPLWIVDDDEVIDRSILFQRLCGFVTYGSPLDKFAYLWSQIVNINKDTSPWSMHNGLRQDAFEWINVYEHSDPVASSLGAYSGAGIPLDSPAPVNLAYKASPVLLLSHLEYLRFRFKPAASQSDQLVSRLLHWMLDGHSAFPQPGPRDRCWYRRKSPVLGLLLRAPWWLAGTAVFVLALAYLGVPALLEILSWISSAQILEDLGAKLYFDTLAADFDALPIGARALGVLLVGAGVVTLAGIARRILER
jgi:hypothetical protein